MSYYTIHLVNIQVARPSRAVRDVIEQAFAPLIREAGHEPNFVNVTAVGSCDVSIEFVRNFPQMGSIFRGPMVLAEQSGVILVGSILELRVHGTGRTPSDLIAATRPIFLNDEIEFAKTTGNIAVHELAHAIGGLPHHPTPTNFLYSGSFLHRDHQPSWFTYEHLRAHWSAQRTFDSSQRQTLVNAIRTRELLGIEFTRVP
jgi:hypothetical protein